ncbi:MAG: hypothetical protein ACK4UX_13285, partial [Thiobacillus sp.]
RRVDVAAAAVAAQRAHDEAGLQRVQPAVPTRTLPRGQPPPARAAEDALVGQTRPQLAPARAPRRPGPPQQQAAQRAAEAALDAQSRRELELEAAEEAAADGEGEAGEAGEAAEAAEAALSTLRERHAAELAAAAQKQAEAERQAAETQAELEQRLQHAHALLTGSVAEAGLRMEWVQALRRDLSALDARHAEVLDRHEA